MEGKSATWRKSSYSGNTSGNCVELGQAPGEVLVRDTKDHGCGPVLKVTPAAWRSFTDGVRQA